MAVVIYPPTINWNWMIQRPQQLMRQFSLDGHEVYYCNKKQSATVKYSRISPSLTVVHDNKDFIRHGVPKLKKQGKKIIVWASCAKQYPFLEQYMPDRIVFDYVDDFPAWAPYVEKMAVKSDLIFASAAELHKQIDGFAPYQPSYLVPNACNIQLFQQYSEGQAPKRPPEFEGHEGKIVTFIGAYAQWVDKDLMSLIAKTFPDTLLAVVGPEFGAPFQLKEPNIRFIGLKPHHALPAYLYYSDVCIIPFKINRITLASNPVKMYEYLAAGKPVVSTDLPETRGIPYVYNAPTSKRFIEHLAHVLDPSFEFDRNRVNQWLADHSWEVRYREIRSKMERHFPNLFEK